MWYFPNPQRQWAVEAKVRVGIWKCGGKGCIFPYIYHINQPNIGKYIYIIQGSFGSVCQSLVKWCWVKYLMTGGILLMLQSFWTAIHAQGFLYIVVFAGFLCFIKSISWDQSMVNLPLYIEFIFMVNLGQSNSKYTVRPMDPSWLWNVWVVKGVWTNWDSTARSSPTSPAESTPPHPGWKVSLGSPKLLVNMSWNFPETGKIAPEKK